MSINSQTISILDVDDTNPVICLPRTHYSGFPISRLRATIINSIRITVQKPLPVESQSREELTWKFFSNPPHKHFDDNLKTCLKPLPIEPHSIPIPMDPFPLKKSHWGKGSVVWTPLAESTKSRPMS